ncbi:unnamed protein product [Phytomonas sp. Hart1]|nr:unnamed protein product [Phytomonas sp. Hart1]|eukprot:CCW68655.1 unnamed protein product [Phytomonas sp. isolate Hart1]
MLSAKALLALLRETNEAVIFFALKRLVDLMDTFWCEIAADLPLIEELQESESLSLKTRKLAALVTSQVYFHLGAYDDSVHHALQAGEAFDGMERSLFTDTILSRCIDQYIEQQKQEEQKEGELKKVDPRLETLFLNLTKQWVQNNESVEEIKELVGLTILSRRIDFLEIVLKQCLKRGESSDILNFTFNTANVLLRDIGFRRKILRLLAVLYTEGAATMDYFSMVQCLLFLSDTSSTANLIRGLIKAGDTMMAYQLAFDLFEHGSQDFLSILVKNLEGDSVITNSADNGASLAVSATPAAGNVEEASMDPAQSVPQPALTTEVDPIQRNLIAVLCGEVTSKLYLKFLYSRCVADVHILNQIKKRIDTKKSLLHNATVMANALMYSGTTIDGFLRDNTTWLARADYWAKFTATASVGVIHRGHTGEAMKLLDPYLPKGSLPALPYQEGGSLYALGLIYSPLGLLRDHKVVDYLMENLRKYSDKAPMVHGASLGLGLAAMGLQDENIFDTLFTCVTGSDAVGGEGAAVAIGMLHMGSGNFSVISSLKNVASEEMQKEKVIRGACMAMALINLGRENEALGLANELLESGEPWIRLGGCFVIGMAFAGTENTTAIGRLLQVTVKDTSDDVRRNAAMMVGFLSFRDPALCLCLVRILVDSYNPHIRYGVAMALGVCAAGTGSSEIINVLWEMKDDLNDLVRQGVLIALALVMTQLTEYENSKVKEFRQLLDAKIGDRRETLCIKLGSILASGLLDCGGRNCTFALHRDRHRMDKAVAGMFFFTQYWYWYPYVYMVSLAMLPTCFIGLNDKLEMPEYTFLSNAPPHHYAVPKSVLQEKKEVKLFGVQAVVLSTTRKEEELQRQRRGKQSLHETESKENTKAATGSAAANEGPNAPGADQKRVSNAEADGKSDPHDTSCEILHNPARVTAHQFAFISHTVNGRYVPLKPNPIGVCLLKDTMPNLGEQKLIVAIDPDDKDAPPPEPFMYS